MRIQRAKIPTVDEVHEVRASLFLDKLRTTLTSGEYKKQDHLIERLLEEGFSSTDIASALIHHLPRAVMPRPQNLCRVRSLSLNARNVRLTVNAAMTVAAATKIVPHAMPLIAMTNAANGRLIAIRATNAQHRAW